MNLMRAVKVGQLTGRTCYRTDWRGRLILQVQYYAQASSNDIHNPVHESDCQRRWRDAKVQDLEGPLNPSVA